MICVNKFFIPRRVPSKVLKRLLTIGKNRIHSKQPPMAKFHVPCASKETFHDHSVSCSLLEVSKTSRVGHSTDNQQFSLKAVLE